MKLTSKSNLATLILVRVACPISFLVCTHVIPHSYKSIVLKLFRNFFFKILSIYLTNNAIKATKLTFH
jgi:hypothetical protein